MDYPNNYDNWKERMDRIENRFHREELRYAMFRAQRLPLSCRMLPGDYVDLANSVSMRLIFCDPNFDFSAPTSLNNYFTSSRPRVLG